MADVDKSVVGGGGEIAVDWEGPRPFSAVEGGGFRHARQSGVYAVLRQCAEGNRFLRIGEAKINFNWDINDSCGSWSKNGLLLYFGYLAAPEGRQLRTPENDEIWNGRIKDVAALLVALYDPERNFDYEKIPCKKNLRVLNMGDYESLFPNASANSFRIVGKNYVRYGYKRPIKGELGCILP